MKLKISSNERQAMWFIHNGRLYANVDGKFYRLVIHTSKRDGIRRIPRILVHREKTIRALKQSLLTEIILAGMKAPSRLPAAFIRVTGKSYSGDDFSQQMSIIRTRNGNDTYSIFTLPKKSHVEGSRPWVGNVPMEQLWRLGLRILELYVAAKRWPYGGD